MIFYVQSLSSNNLNYIVFTMVPPTFDGSKHDRGIFHSNTVSFKLIDGLFIIIVTSHNKYNLKKIITFWIELFKGRIINTL